MTQSGLQFFATNRSMDNLGRLGQASEDKSLQRETRLHLAKGGYYFVDMYKYMPFFFGEVDYDQMPPSAIVEKSDDTVFGGFLDNKAVKDVVICVHGFNVHLQAAFTWFRIMTDTMRNLGYGASIATSSLDVSLKGAQPGTVTAFIGFSWPSNGNVLSYNRDQLDAASSGQALANLIARLHIKGKTVHLICHSMGNYLACSMFAGLVNEQFVPSCFSVDYLKDKGVGVTADDREARLKGFLSLIHRNKRVGETEEVEGGNRFVERYIMIAPDVERRHITKGFSASASKDPYVGPFYSGLQHLVAQVVNFYSRFDGALNVSTLEKKPKSAVLAVGDAVSSLTFGLLDFLERNPDYKWEMRLGSSAHPTGAPLNISSVNSTELAGRPIDHSDHIDSRFVVDAIAAELGLKKST